MCGICGIVGIDEPDLIVSMSETLEHRGPDDHGTYHDGDVRLGHRRLSVIDVAGGHQPMATEDGSLVIVYNGEVYNYRELRRDLEQRGHRFRTESDTEVVLELFRESGPACLERLNGMFAFAVHDRRRGELFLARDRIGIKPLYYVELPGAFLFASEVKSLLRHEGWTPTINPRAIHDYLALRYVPGTTSIFNEVRRLPAGHYLTLRDGRVELRRYWAPPIGAGSERRSDDDYLDELAERMEASVRRRLITDVSFGAYLSGGLDSSVIVASMARLVDRPIKTFSVGFDYEHDELEQAAFTARHLGCEHHEISCGADDVQLLPRIVYHMDEPMGDAIILPMYKLSREAKKQVTVILTGEGGDEIFGGYLFHKLMWAAEIYRRAVPGPFRHWVVEPLISATPAGLLNVAFQYPAYLGRRGKQKVLDYLDLLDDSRLEGAYRHLISLFDARDTGPIYTEAFRARLEPTPPAEIPVSETSPSAEAFLNRLIRLQFGHWLPDNMLLRQDKTGMANGIEGRVPFLDHELVEFALRLPRRLKLNRMTGKFILRRYAERLLPSEVVHRKKMPFYVPIENYFQHPAFQEMLHDLLSDASVRNRGIFRVEAVADLRGAMQRREFMLVKQVFSLMILELWFRIFVDRSVSWDEVRSPAVSAASG
jgi:asparagine synthase (glutamine-hydrolysing)